MTEPAAPSASSGPYVGLTHYNEDQASLFFGRDAESAVIIGNLRASRLTLLYAESGVGKSSVLRAAVAARLRAQAERDLTVRGAPRFVPVVFSSWTDDPVARLIEAIEDAARPLLAEPSSLSLPRDSIERAIDVASEAMGALLLIVLDQFEEYFLYRSGHDRNDEFADQLSTCVNRGRLSANFVISIREDAYAGLGDLFQRRIANVYANFLHLEYLSRDGGREAIERPVEEFNHQNGADFAVEPDLVDAVLDGVRLGGSVADGNGHGPAANDGRSSEAGLIETTYLQLVMKRLWEEEISAGVKTLRLETLERLGGAQAIIGTHLDRAMAELPNDQQDAAASMFTFLVTRAGTKIALTANDLSELAGVELPQVETVARRLAAGDLHILRPVDSRAGTAWEIFHDALARPIVEWRTRYRERRQRERQGELAKRLEGERLEKENAQRQAVEAAKREARERKRKRWAVMGVAVLVVSLLGTAVALALVQRNNARKLEKIDTSNEIAGRISRLSSSPSLGPPAQALAALEAFRLSPTFNARQQILAPLGDNVGIPKVLVGHARPVLAVALSPADGLVASGSDDGSVRLWGRSGLQGGSTLQGPVSKGEVTGLAFKGDLLVAARQYGTIDLWRLPKAAGEPAARDTLTTVSRSGACFDSPPCGPVAVSPRGDALAWGGRDRVEVWTGRPQPDERPTVLSSGPAPEQVHGLAFSPDGRDLAVASDSGLGLWRLSGHALNFSRTLESSLPATSVAWASDGKLAAGTEEDAEGHIFLWSSTGHAPTVLKAPASVSTLAFVHRGDLLASGGGDQNVSVWDTRTGARVGPPRSHSGWVNGIAASAGGDTIVSGADDSLVKLWPLAGDGALATTVADSGDIEDVAMGGGRRAATAGHAIVLWKRSRKWTPWRRISKLAGLPPIAFQGHLLAGTSRDGGGTGIKLWDTARSCPGSPRGVCSLGSADAGGEPWAMSFDPAGTVLATGTGNGVLTLWDPAQAGSPRRLGASTQRPGIEKLAFSPRGNALIATAGSDGTVRLWDASAIRRGGRIDRIGKPLRLHAGVPVKALAFAPDGELLATGGEDDAVVLWNVQRPAEPKRVGLPLYQSNSVYSIVFSPDGRTLLVGVGDGNICPYDVRSLEPIGSQNCLTGSRPAALTAGITALTFDRRDDTLVSGGPGTPVVAWNSILWSQGRDTRTLRRLGDAACLLAARNLTAAEWTGVFAGTELERHRHATCPNFAR